MGEEQRSVREQEKGSRGRRRGAEVRTRGIGGTANQVKEIVWPMEQG